MVFSFALPPPAALPERGSVDRSPDYAEHLVIDGSGRRGQWHGAVGGIGLIRARHKRPFGLILLLSLMLTLVLNLIARC